MARQHRKVSIGGAGNPASPQGDLQDGMLAYYLDQAASADANVEARIAREPFDFRDKFTPPNPEPSRSFKKPRGRAAA